MKTEICLVLSSNIMAWKTHSADKRTLGRMGPSSVPEHAEQDKKECSSGICFLMSECIHPARQEQIAKLQHQHPTLTLSAPPPTLNVSHHCCCLSQASWYHSPRLQALQCPWYLPSITLKFRSSQSCTQLDYQSDQYLEMQQSTCLFAPHCRTQCRKSCF
jgi:hypothetical protein